VSHQVGMWSLSLAPSAGAQGEGSPHPHLADVGTFLPSFRNNTKFEVTPRATECDHKQCMEEIQAGSAEGVSGCASGGQSLPKELDKHGERGLLCSSCFPSWGSHCCASECSTGDLSLLGLEE